jgi:mRNA-degrading endonuclease RelE of RelBE toxin-antitoxin system
MQEVIASLIMRMTIDIDEPILKELKRLQRREGKSLGRLVSDLLVQSLAKDPERKQLDFHWVAKSKGARVNRADNNALLDAMNTN